MTDEKIILLKNWFKKANNDLLTAKVLMSEPEYPTDIVCFHCQQSIEKSLKAYLIYLDIEFRKTHDLVYLLNLAKFETAIIDKYLEIFSEINYFSVSARYPDEAEDPSIEDTQKIYSTAVEIYDFLYKLIFKTLF